MRRALVALIVLATVVVSFAFTSPRPQTLEFGWPREGRIDASILILPFEQAERLLSRGGSAVGLGVFPPSRDPALFLSELDRSALDNEEHVVSNALLGNHVAIGEDFLGVSPVSILDEGRPDGELRGVLNVVDVRTEAEARERIGQDDVEIVLGVGKQTPLLVGVVRHGGLLAGGIVRRDGVITPYDVGATILDVFGIKPSSDHSGKPLGFIIGANLLFGILLAGLRSIGLPAMGLVLAIYALVIVACMALQTTQTSPRPSCR